jgi:hypothetical protein
MASIYDSNFDNNYQTYRNKQRLAGGQIDPRAIGAIAEADISARYADQRSRRSQDLQQQSIDNSYELGKANLAQQGVQSDRAYAMAKAQDKTQKQSAMIGNLTSMPGLALAGYKTGQDAGLWGKQTPSELQQEQAAYLRRLNNPQGVQAMSLADYGSYAGDLAGTFMDSGSNVAESLGGYVLPSAAEYVSPYAASTMADAFQENDWDWMRMFEGW